MRFGRGGLATSRALDGARDKLASRRLRPAQRVAPIVLLGLWITGCGSNVTVLVPPDEAKPLFRDDFDGPTLEAGWAVQGDATVPHSLDERPGFLRVFSQEVALEDTAFSAGVLVREQPGDFRVVTRMQFETVLDFQLAGIVITGPDPGRSVAFGLLSARGPRGSFRGLLLRADRGAEAPVGRAALPFEGNEVFLQLTREGSRYTASFSEDGVRYTAVGSVSNNLPDEVQVGLGAVKGDACGEHCGRILPADFDFFEIAALDEAAPG